MNSINISSENATLKSDAEDGIGRSLLLFLSARSSRNVPYFDFVLNNTTMVL